MTDPALARAAQFGHSLFGELGLQTRDAPGVTRVAYGEGEHKAFALAAAAAAGMGASAVFDPAGNQFLTLPGRNRSARILIGSHLDSVPHGGNFDGAAGVFLGLALQAAFVEGETMPAFDLTIACLRAEESCWFPHSYIGSKSALGCLDPRVDEVRRSDTGRSLADHMRGEGFDPEAVRRGARWLDPSRILAFIEPHIEQAPLLLSRGSRSGSSRGFADLAATAPCAVLANTPILEPCRGSCACDAVVASARLVLELDALWTAVQQAGEDLTVTFGEFGTDPGAHSFSKIAGETRLCLDLRSQSRATLERTLGEVERVAGIISAVCGVSFELGP